MKYRFWILLSVLSFSLLSACENTELEYAVAADSVIPSYHPRFGRPQPIVAVVGENTFTELTDFVVPYGVMKESGVANVITLGSKKGPIKMFPALKLEPHLTTSEFDLKYPLGADYVFVPAVHNSNDSALIKWIVEQSNKGTTIIGVCDGVRVVANAGLLTNKKAVGHWYSIDDLSKEFTETEWFSNARYIADENIITTTGVTASIPVSIALVEAIAGREKAAQVAQTLGIKSWGSEHQSKKYRLSFSHISTAAVNWLSFWSKEEIAIPITDGVDEIALALSADPYSRTYKSKVFSLSESDQAVLSRRGLKIIPDRNISKIADFDHVIELEVNSPPAAALDTALSGISKMYGEGTSAWVALQLEYSKK